MAEHSLLVADVAREQPLDALLHDAAKAFMGDITCPLKQLLPPEYKRIEENVQGAILSRFGLQRQMTKAIKVADLQVLAAEQLQIMPPGTADWATEQGIEPAQIVIQHLPPAMAFAQFMVRYHQFTRAIRLETREGCIH